MKKNYVFTLCIAFVSLILASCGGLNKMVKMSAEVRYEATPDVLEEKGDMIDVSIEGTFPARYFNKNAAILVQPVLRYEGGETALTPITLKGENVEGEGIVISSAEGGFFNYSEQISYNPAMNRSELILAPIAYMAKDGILDSEEAIIANVKNAIFDETKIADGVIYTSERILLNMDPSVSDHGYKKEVIIEKKANIFFPQNLHAINHKLELNQQEKAVDDLSVLLEQLNQGWEIKSFDIDGWSSPEGKRAFNEKLAEKRADVVYKAMKEKLKKIKKAKNIHAASEGHEKDITYNVNSHGPDWEHFMQEVEKSDIADKSIILEALNTANDEKMKEEELSNIYKNYPETEKILASLRRTEIRVQFYEPKKTDGQIADYAVNDPGALSVSELLYAASMASSEQQLGIYETIMQQYPQCWRAKNNAATIHIKNGDYEKAAELLEEAEKLNSEKSEIFYNKGILYAYQRNFMEAEKYFMQAKELGHQVDYSLGIIEIAKGDYNKAVGYFGNIACDYNKSLAQLLTGAYGEAESNLKCYSSDEKAAAAYLLAVIGARTNNTALLYENLRLAIAGNADYKAQAKDDREFINFEPQPEFKSIVE